MLRCILVFQSTVAIIVYPRVAWRGTPKGRRRREAERLRSAIAHQITSLSPEIRMELIDMAC